jgi:hypothetical protein
MLLINTIIAALCGSALVALPAFAQENPASKTGDSIRASALFAETAHADLARQRLAADYRLRSGSGSFFTHYSSASSAKLSDANTSGAPAHVVLAVYVVQVPAKQWSPFVLTGAGLFDPKIVAAASTQIRLEYLYGGSADSDLRRRIYPPTKHRGNFYNSATFNTGGLNDLYRFNNDAAPPVVLGYTF